MKVQALEYCTAITVRGRNNLSQAAARLREAEKRALFYVTYAAMRVLDDAVDVRFLSLPAPERQRRRPQVLALIDRWSEQVAMATAGRRAEGPEAFEPAVFGLLAEHLSKSEIGLGPWQALARSVRRDAQEIRPATWADLLDYCEGACVAPGAVFLYILACRVTAGGRTRVSLPRPVTDHARSMALFCYLTHILRDLEQDARGNPQLLTFPDDLLARAGLSLPAFVAAARAQEVAALAPVTSFMVGQAEHFGAQARQDLAELAGTLGREEGGVLQDLFERYVSTFEGVRDRYVRGRPCRAPAP